MRRMCGCGVALLAIARTAAFLACTGKDPVAVGESGDGGGSGGEGGPSSGAGALTVTPTAVRLDPGGPAATVTVSFASPRDGHVRVRGMPDGVVSSPVATGGDAAPVTLSLTATSAAAEASVVATVELEEDPTVSAPLGIVVRGKPGTTDTLFGQNGWAEPDPGPNGEDGIAVAVQSDGKIVVAGTEDIAADSAQGATWIVARFGADGKLDPAFGAGGVTKIDFGGKNAAPTSILIEPDGTIAVAGWVSAGGNSTWVAAAHLDAAGALDPVFGGGAPTFATIPGSSRANGVVLGPSSTLMLVGTTAGGTTTPDFLLVRVRPNGTLDPSFKTKGWTTYDVSPADDGAAIVADGDGFVVGGTVTGNGDKDLAILRFLGTGDPDKAFGPSSGRYAAPVTLSPQGTVGDDVAYAIARDGKGFVVAGTTTRNTETDFGFLRSDTAGLPVPGWGNGGSSKNLAIGQGKESAYAVVSQADDLIVAAGDVLPGPQIAVVRLVRGAVDPTFGTGKTFLEGTGHARGIAIHEDGIVIVGTRTDPPGSVRRLAVVRMWQ